ncbi:MAG TPA: hypothetical protein PLY50_11660, partial [Burkholderiaceae bacterium]|nr:hypothetical protein [Burkholderiaceae bacterium]
TCAYLVLLRVEIARFTRRMGCPIRRLVSVALILTLCRANASAVLPGTCVPGIAVQAPARFSVDSR